MWDRPSLISRKEAIGGAHFSLKDKEMRPAGQFARAILNERWGPRKPPEDGDIVKRFVTATNARRVMRPATALPLRLLPARKPKAKEWIGFPSRSPRAWPENR